MKEGIPMVWTMATFIGFTILVAVISYVKTKGDDQSTADGYFLAGRGLPGFVIAGSLLLTNLSAEQLVGTNGQTWSVGMSPMAFEIVAAPCCIVLALFAAPRYLKSGITTIPELIGLRYDRSTKLWFSIAYILLYIVVQIPVILYSGSLVFENIFKVSGSHHSVYHHQCHRLDLRDLRRTESRSRIGYRKRHRTADRRLHDPVLRTERARQNGRR